MILFRDRIATAAPQGRRQPSLNALKPGHRTALLTPIQAQLDRAAKHNFPLLFSGPCGSGRLPAAQYLHEMAHAEGLSPLTLSAADLTPQMLSDAMQAPPRTTRKTAPPPILILNRIEKMVQRTQDRLLTILRSPDAVNLPRIVALTMSSPEMIRHRDGLQDGRWHRLMVDHIRFPALADRAADIPAVAVETLTILAHRLNMTAPALTESAARYLCAQRWPANLHEFESVLLSCLLSHSDGTHLSETKLRDHHNQATTMATVGPQDPRFADWLTDAMAAGRVSVSEIEERIYAAALSQARGNMAAAARLVGLTRAQLAYRIKQSDDQADGARTKS
ncbi:MAG: hypothetical protein KKB02_02260 [Alphaproteobacteria bacterium]|nr:hypothetical protein [Alphaproteobacteria bacterium]